MSVRILAIPLAALLLLTGATAAQAEFYMPKPQAASFVRSDVTARYVYSIEFGAESSVNVDCRPSRLAKLNPHRGRAYHRWVCAWEARTLDDKSCTGKMLIVGSASDHNNTYYQATLAGARCTT